MWNVNRVTYGEVYVSTLVIHEYPGEGASTLYGEAIANAFDGHVSDVMEFGEIRFVIRWACRRSSIYANRSTANGAKIHRFGRVWF